MRVPRTPKAPTPYQMKEAIQNLGFPKLKGEQTPDCIRRSAEAIGISERLARTYWYGETERPDPYHYALILDAIDARGTPPNEISRLEARVAELERIIMAANPREDRQERDRQGRGSNRERRQKNGFRSSPLAG